MDEHIARQRRSYKLLATERPMLDAHLGREEKLAPDLKPIREQYVADVVERLSRCDRESEEPT